MIAIGEGQLHGFDNRMQILRAVVSHGLQIVSLEDVQRFDHDRTLCPEPRLVDLIAAVGARHRGFQIDLDRQDP